MKFRWVVAPSQPVRAAPLARQFNLSLLLAQCLLNRGLQDPEQIERFLDPRLSTLADPFLLPDMTRAVDRLFEARERGEPLVIFGDYDVDGVTATALLTQALRNLGWKVDYYLPHRLEEGYGLSQAAVDKCLSLFPATLLLAVDCGSTAGELIAGLGQRGVDVVVLDHHQVSVPPPQPLALVNPQVAPPTEPSFRELCSAGLAFKLAHAVVKRGRQQGHPQAEELDLRQWLDLVALGTIADLVPVTGENRILVNRGLEWLNRMERPGLVALRNVAQIARTIGSYEVGFQLAPRLNAAGRLENALEALELLLANELVAAEPMAARLDARNRERQRIEKNMTQEVIESLRARFDPERDFAIVEGHDSWHLGVVGIVASRVVQEFHRPAVILGGNGAEWRGSGRSVEGFDLAAALHGCRHLLVRQGGHAMAAGLSIWPEQLKSFREQLNTLARAALGAERLQPALRLDARVALEDLTLAQVEELARLQQTGIDNPPVQCWVGEVVHSRPGQRMGQEKQHAKFWVTDGRVVREAVWWQAGSAAWPVGRFDLAFAPQVNEFNGTKTVQLRVLDWRPVES